MNLAVTREKTATSVPVSPTGTPGGINNVARPPLAYTTAMSESARTNSAPTPPPKMTVESLNFY